MSYDAMPQTGELNIVNNKPILMELDALVEGILEQKPNCLEWQGRDIDGRWGSRRAVPLPPETELTCSRCGKEKNHARFRVTAWKRPDGRVISRYHSWCRECESETANTRKKITKRTPKHRLAKSSHNCAVK